MALLRTLLESFLVYGLVFYMRFRDKDKAGIMKGRKQGLAFAPLIMEWLMYQLFQADTVEGCGPS